MQALQAVFGTQQHIVWWQECVRALVVFAYGLALMRVSGRRTFGRWSALDIVVSIVFGSSLSRALTGNAPFGGTLTAMTVLIALHWALARAVTVSAKAADALEGEPVTLAEAGSLHDDSMRGFSVSGRDLHEALRGAGILHLSEARLVMLEPSGKISVVKQG